MAGVVWCGMMWCGVEWCGVEWCGVVWLVWCGPRRKTVFFKTSLRVTIICSLDSMLDL